MKVIDGSQGEGGGSIVRLGGAFSVLSQSQVRITNIRRGRRVPGLRTQHLVGLKALTTLTGGELRNARVGSLSVDLSPGKSFKNQLQLEIGTAGSIGLVIQVLQIACVHAPHPIRVEIIGGATFGKWAPTITYLEEVTLHLLSRMGYKINLSITRHGFYPRGGARVSIDLHPPEQLNPISIPELGRVEEIFGLSIASKHLTKPRVAERQARSATRFLEKSLGVDPDIKTEYVDASCPGSGLTLWLKSSEGAILGTSIVGERGLRSETIGENAANDLIKAVRVGATVDTFHSDQIIPFMGLAEGESLVISPELTSHAQTNILLTQEFLKREFQTEKKELGGVQIHCSQ